MIVSYCIASTCAAFGEREAKLSIVDEQVKPEGTTEMATTSLESSEDRASQSEGKTPANEGKASAKVNGLLKDRNGNGDTRFDPHAPWTVETAAKLYGIQQWGQGYFSINDD